MSKPNGENGEARKTERLASLFSTTRDLNLMNGKTNQRSTAANKKIYTPNLNAARNKNSEKLDKDAPKKDQKSDRAKRGGRGGKSLSNGNLSKRTSNLVPTMGVFSEGIAAVTARRSEGSYGGGSSRDNVACEAIIKPRITRRDQKVDKIDLDADRKTLSDLLGDENDEDDEKKEDDNNKTSFSDDIQPIKIVDHTRRSFLTGGLIRKKLDTDVKIKVEPKDCDDVEMAKPDASNILPNGATIKAEPGEPKTDASYNMDQMFSTFPHQFMLFQLPDTLPGRTPDTESEDVKEQQSSIKLPNRNLCSLEQFQEGLIGKLVRYKSGKNKLVLGDMVYDLDVGLNPDFQQNAVTINANREERSANMYSLGQIQAKYNVTPDWNHLFHKINS